MKYEDWPLNTPQPIAWGVEEDGMISSGNPTTVTAIPIFPEEVGKPMTWETYTDRLAERVIWMISQEESLKQALRMIDLKMEEAGVWLGNQPASAQEAGNEMIAGNPPFLSLLTQLADFPETIVPSRMPEVVSSIKDTTLEEWLDLALPAMSDR